MNTDAIATAAALERADGAPAVDLAWLEESWQQPDALADALQRSLAGPSTGPFKSTPGRSYDLYHDWVGRHVGKERIAVRCYERLRASQGAWASLSYDELDRRCAARAASWAAQGVEPGSVVAVVRWFGVDAVVSILAGLRLGVCISLLEPLAPTYVDARLTALSPQYVCSVGFHAPWLGAFAELRLSASEFRAEPMATSHAYAAGDLCAIVFSPLRRSAEIPVPLTASTAHLGALRDGTLTLALRPGDALAAPGFHTAQYQPALLFSSLCAGGTYVHAPHEEVLENLSLLDEYELRTLGIDARTCEALLADQSRGSHAWEHIVRNPEEPTDWEAWSQLIEQRDLGKTAMSNVLFEAASGGALLSSPRRPGSEHLAALMNLVPAAGRPWALLDFTRSGQRSAGHAGVYAPADPAPPAEPEDGPAEPMAIEPIYVALGRRRGGEYLYGGTLEPRRSGRVYPADEVIAALEDCPFLNGVSVVVVPEGGATLAQRFVLLGFCGHEENSRFTALSASRREDITRMLDARLGPDARPDRIELFPLLPRLNDGVIDHAWCQEQYRTGTLYAKSRTTIFLRTTELRQVTTG